LQPTRDSGEEVSDSFGNLTNQIGSKLHKLLERDSQSAEQQKPVGDSVESHRTKKAKKKNKTKNKKQRQTNKQGNKSRSLKEKKTNDRNNQVGGIL
jgi:hypothetical protein